MATPIVPASLLQLTCFVRVIESGSFAEAGRRLGMTTSGVSKAISRLEADHQIRLLHRSTHALSLTEAGELLLEEAREVLQASDRVALVLSQAADDGRAGRVRISAPPGFTRTCLLPALARLLDAHREIRVEVGASYDLVDLADEGVDLALRAGPLAGVPGHVSMPLLSSPWCAYATPGYLARRGEPLCPRDLADHELIGFRNRATGRMSRWRFRDPAAGLQAVPVSLDASPRMVFDDGAAAYDMALTGHGVVLAPEWLAVDDLAKGRIVEVLRTWRADEVLISVVRRQRRLTPQRVTIVTNFLRRSAALWRAPG